MTNFSLMQITALDRIGHWLKHGGQEFVLAGYAGTGKTTLARHLQNSTELSMQYCAFTGKAAQTLRSKGVDNVSTIHSMLYMPIDKENTRAKILQLRQDIENNKVEDLQKARKRLEKLERDLQSPYFVLREGLEEELCDIIVVDEYSMLSNAIREDILKTGKRVLYLGDPGQLPPVNGSNDITPDYFLTEVHRQALESPILAAATMVREQGIVPQHFKNEFYYIPKEEASYETVFKHADQILVAYHKTRKTFNKRMRQIQGYDPNMPCIGERVVCLKNKHNIGIFNGSIGKITSQPEMSELQHIMRFDFREESWGEGADLEVEAYAPLLCHGKEQDPTDPIGIPFDYAYAITGHKSQGSEWDAVAIYNEPFFGKMAQQARQWVYTTITRARKTCYFVDATGGNSF